jgi:hypothetical protein
MSDNSSCYQVGNVRVRMLAHVASRPTTGLARSENGFKAEEMKDDWGAKCVKTVRHGSPERRRSNVERNVGERAKGGLQTTRTSDRLKDVAGPVFVVEATTFKSCVQTLTSRKTVLVRSVLSTKIESCSSIGLFR